MIGTFWAGLWLGLALSSGLIRYYIYAAVTFVGSIPFMLTTFEGKLAALSQYLLALAVCYIIAGIFFFSRFLMKYPPQPQEISDESR